MLKTFEGLEVASVAKVSGVHGAGVPGAPPAVALDGLPDAILDQQRQSWLDGTPLTVEEILSGTAYQNDREALLDLLYNEIVVQEEIGIQPSFDDYIRRYPQLEQDLRLHFEVHQAVNQQSLLDTSTLEKEPSWPVSESRTQRAGLPLDRYKIERIIGEGGMAVVYQARHLMLHRNVALKVFQSGRKLTAREIFRIRTEAEAMARLSHPNIVQIFEIGDCDGAPYLALELAEQGTLAQKLQQFPFTPTTAATLIEILARALQHAHDRQILHRDLKPANILFAKDGTPKITDFGLAKILLDSDISPVNATQSGETLGTPRYMAPEQAAGQHELVSPATDVYALGTLLYECLTGRAPFVSANVVDTLRQICIDDPMPPRRLQASIPRDLETICLHCLEKHPSRRYTTALDLADDLHRFLGGKAIRARPVPMWEHVWKWCRKNPSNAALIALGSLLGMVGLLSAVIAPQIESRRLARLRNEVAVLVQQGRDALDFDEIETAQGRFNEAWMKVRAEPALVDHETSVSGWLDHSRNAMNRSQWQQRIPPRDFDARFDEALLLSSMSVPHLPNPFASARKAIEVALELTIPHDPAWKLEREQLLLLDAEIISQYANVSEAIAVIDSTEEFQSRRYYSRLADLFEQNQQPVEAASSRQLAEQFPPQNMTSRFYAGIGELRLKRFQQAATHFESVLSSEPGHFAARLMQSICYLNLHRTGEAKVGLTACIAQRPRFPWNYFFRSQAHVAAGEVTDAIQDLSTAIETRPSESMRFVALTELGITHLHERNLVDASHAFTLLTERFPDQFSGWIFKGWTELLRNRPTESESDFERAAELLPVSPEVFAGQMVLRMAKGDLRTVQEIILRSILQWTHKMSEFLHSKSHTMRTSRDSSPAGRSE